MLLANSSNEQVRVPGNMKPRGVAVHPSPTQNVAVGWRSPEAATLRVEGQVARAHPECGNGVTWSLQLRRGSTRQYLAQGEARSAAPVTIGPFDRVRVQPGDLISVLVGPREGNHSCDLTAVDLRLTATDATSQTWSLADDVAGNVLAGNPHPDSAGRADIWHFYTEPVASEGTDTVLPAGSLLARWQSAESHGRETTACGTTRTTLTGPPPSSGANAPDAALYRQLTSLAGPLFAGVTTRHDDSPERTPGDSIRSFSANIRMELPIDAASLCARAPSVIAVRLPADLVANSELVVTGTLAGRNTTEGSVQLEVLRQRPEARASLLPDRNGGRRHQGDVDLEQSDCLLRFARHHEARRRRRKADGGGIRRVPANVPRRALLHEDRPGGRSRNAHALPS